MRVQGLDAINGRDARGDYARPRRFELAAAFNRLRGLKMSQTRYGGAGGGSGGS